MDSWRKKIGSFSPLENILNSISNHREKRPESTQDETKREGIGMDG
nr:MAG TPA: hypothetical protein [Caudoviricetes sp.]